MTTALLVLVCVLAVTVFVMFSALIEMFHQLKQVRDHLEMFDKPRPVELAPGAIGSTPSTVGLPGILDDAGEAVVLFLSNRCQTCFQLADSLRGALPAKLWLVVLPVGGTDAAEFTNQFELRGERVLVDGEMQIATKLGVDSTPIAIGVSTGRIQQARSVPSVRQLRAMLSTQSPSPVDSAELVGGEAENAVDRKPETKSSFYS